MDDPQLLAGTLSALIFIGSNFPMLYKSIKTRNLSSYSLGQLTLANVGNVIHWLYVASLPFGPIWFLHGFHTLVAIAMLALYTRYEILGKLRELSVNQKKIAVFK